MFYPQISNAFAELGNMIATGIDNIADWFGSLGNKNTDIGTGKISILGRLHGNITFSRQRNEGRDTGLRDILHIKFCELLSLNRNLEKR